MARFEYTGTRLSNTGRGEHTQRPHKHGCFVTEDIPKNVSADNGVKLLRPPNELHGSIVHIHMTEFYIREILGNDIRDNLTPQLRHIQDIGLVDTAKLSTTFGSYIPGHTGNALNLVFGVNHIVVPHTFAVDNVNTLGGTKVDISGKFTNTHDIDSLDNFPLESGSFNQLRENLGRTQVGKETHLLPHLEQPRFGTKFTGIGIPLVSSNAGQKD
mmetsp:Transcript_20106/g.24143  ORF Transcript_20106/g.24143 Transcript_20106/m.24143 type:complete len:214 (-) Transcript_20106:244-885(-)